MNPLTPIEVDCVTAVMLKILDGKCKMTADDKSAMGALYDAVGQDQGQALGEEVHRLIAMARTREGEDLKERVYEIRVLAETRISRPVMKAFKVMIRRQGLFELQCLEPVTPEEIQ